MNNREAFRNYLQTAARIGDPMEKTFNAGFLAGLAAQAAELSSNPLQLVAQNPTAWLVRERSKRTGLLSNEILVENKNHIRESEHFKYEFVPLYTQQQDHIGDSNKLVQAVNALAAQTGESPELIIEWLTDKGGLTQLMLSHFGGMQSQAQQESQWISVGERLPEVKKGDYENVIVCKINPDGKKYVFEASYLNELELQFDESDEYRSFSGWHIQIERDGDDHFEGIQYGIVTHWMVKPLPPAPEGDKP